MKFKFTWPMGIVLAIVLFMAYILQFVYKAMVSPEYDHDLVATDYYQKELKYQSEIDKQKRALKLEQNVTITKDENGLIILFPKKFDSRRITGIVELIRLSDKSADMTLPIIIKDHKLLIEKSKLVKGKYKIIVDWEVDGQSYMLKKEITY